MWVENKKDILNKFAKEIVDRGVSVPAIFFLESTKYISSPLFAFSIKYSNTKQQITIHTNVISFPAKKR